MATDALQMADPLVGLLLDGRYRLEAQLERGGTGTIYRAEHLRIRRPVAVKILRLALADEPRAAERFAREADIISQLEHPNTLKLFDFGRLDDGRPYLVTELLSGRTLARRLEQRPLSIGYATRIAQDVLLSLDEAHSKGIVHRDLKPSNVFLHHTEGGERVRVLDFGIARLTTSNTLTEPGMIMGTPAYMSPEQALKDDVDGRSDLYSVGAILFECLTGRPPFQAPHPQTLILKHALLPAPRLNQVSQGLPEPLEELVAELLAKNAEQRPSSARQVYERLQPFADDPTVAPLARPVSEPVEHQALLRAGSHLVHPEPVSELLVSDPEPEARRWDVPALVGALGIMLLIGAAGIGVVRTLMPGRIDLPSGSPTSRADVIPARPSPVLEPLGPPAPLLHGATPEPEEVQSEPAPRVRRTRVKAPPGFVDVDI